MNFLRNSLAVIVGLTIAWLIITLGIRLNPKWMVFDAFSPFDQWGSFLKTMENDNRFFWFLLLFSGIATALGGVATALIVRYAKVAYAILIGFIMLFFAMLDIIIYPYHPTFYKILIFLTFFPFSWIGGKIVEVIYERNLKLMKKKK